MQRKSFTLVGDGTSDEVLVPILRWLWKEIRPEDGEVDAEFCHRGMLGNPGSSFGSQLVRAVDLYPCDLLFIHRDAEKQKPLKRMEEIRTAVEEAKLSSQMYVCVVPVKMAEAWLLFDEGAIRRAAGNPSGSMPLALPKLSKVEDLPDPKSELHKRLDLANGLNSQRRRKFSTHGAARLVAQHTENFSPLYQLPAFRTMAEAFAAVW